jgi:tRNA U34 5-methylaminomethyl-2-thiouridine-forming methyltransferase MnmC
MNEVRVTGDGSTTLFSADFGEHYHSVYGAVTESRIVFIENGLHFLRKDPVTLFEIGFGTGLNAYLTCLDALQNKRTVNYYAIEKYPLGKNILSSLNYKEILAVDSAHKNIFDLLHKAEWEKHVSITSLFSLYKIRADLCTYYPDFSFDVIFFDAFAPDRQPEIWSTEIFRRLYDKLEPGGVLTTYCVKGLIRKMLKDAGFLVRKIPGPPGKREMLRASKTIDYQALLINKND